MIPALSGGVEAAMANETTTGPFAPTTARR